MPGRCFQARNRLLFAALASLIPGLVCGQTPICPSGTCYLAPSGVNVGIGTASPWRPLVITGNGSDNGGIGDVVVVGTGSIGSSISLSASGAGARTYSLLSTASAAGAGSFGVYDSSSGVYRMLINSTGNMGIGTTNPLYKLAVNGNIGAQDIVVTNTGWSDYVFRPGYRLRPLSEVSQFIQKHRHLPDIPSEAEVKEKGVSVGEMQAKLLAKIEELTLHMIQQNKESREMREQMNQQAKENQKLRDRLARLEARPAQPNGDDGVGR